MTTAAEFQSMQRAQEELDCAGFRLCTASEGFVIMPKQGHHNLYSPDAKIHYCLTLEEVRAWCQGWNARRFYEDQEVKEKRSKKKPEAKLLGRQSKHRRP